MARYNTFKYGSGQKYGEVAANKNSVEPFIAYAQDYNKVLLTWNIAQAESGSIIKHKIVRNQYAYSETQNDGIVLWNDDDGPGSQLLYDTNNIASGRFAFYSYWLQLDDNSWVLAGETSVLVPAKHLSRIYPRYINQDNVSISSDILLQTTHERLMSYLPKILTTGYSSTDYLDSESHLSLFLKGFSFTVDEFLTYGQLVLPGLSGRYSNEAIIKLQGDQLGVPEDTQGLTRTQKLFVRDAIYIYSRKGTLPGLTRFIKALTGYVPTITVSDNKMLSLQNSTFYNGIGNWKTTNGVSLTAFNTTDVPTPGGSDLVVDASWVAKLDCTSSSAGLYLGDESPVTLGIPVVAGQEYSFKYWVKRSGGTGGIFGQSILWYDQTGKKIPETVSQVGETVTTSWAQKTYTRTAPTGAVFASISLAFNSGDIYYLDRVQFAKSDVTTYSEARSVKIYLNPGADFSQTRINKVPRLNSEIKKYLPINTAYFITSSEGLESSGITS